MQLESNFGAAFIGAGAGIAVTLLLRPILIRWLSRRSTSVNSMNNVVETWREGEFQGALAEGEPDRVSLNRCAAEISAIETQIRVLHQEADEAVRALTMAVEGCHRRVAAMTSALGTFDQSFSASSSAEKPRQVADTTSATPLSPPLPSVLLDSYHHSPDEVVHRAVGRAIVRKTGPEVVLDRDDSGRILIFEGNESLIALPHPRVRIDDTAWHDTGIGRLYTCEEFAEGHSYVRFRVEIPAVVSRTATGWILRKAGCLRLTKGVAM